MVLEMVRGVTAFLRLEVGLTRGEVLNQALELEQLRRRLEQKQGQISERDRRLAQHHERASDAPRPTGASQTDTPVQTGAAGRKDRLYTEVSEMINLIPTDFGGGSTLTKTYMMASMIREYDLESTVDIGVYRGRSLFPQALAHRRFTSGTVYGVDPWSASEAQENDNTELKEAIDRWVKETDFQAIYEEVASLRERMQFQDNCVLVRQSSAEAARYFEDTGIFFDMVHIDGNHDTVKVMEDINLYLPRLRGNGFIVLDDISWESVQPAYAKLSAEIPLVFERMYRADDYAVFFNNSSSGAGERRRFLKRIASRYS